MRALTSISVAVWLVACGGAAPAATSPTTATFAAPPAPWAELDHDARRAHMVAHVLPATSDLFSAWDAERYADFSCTTCHGSDAAARGFAMPNPSLITLYPTGTIGQQRVLAQYTEACTFMYSRLVPAMQTMLGEEEYDPETRRGFGCFSCHPRGGDDDPESRMAP